MWAPNAEQRNRIEIMTHDFVAAERAYYLTPEERAKFVPGPELVAELESRQQVFMESIRVKHSSYFYEGIADLYCFPHAVDECLGAKLSSPLYSGYPWLLLGKVLETSKSNYAAELIGNRLRYMLQKPFELNECQHPSQPKYGYLRPLPDWILPLLCKMADHNTTALDILEEFARGDMNVKNIDCEGMLWEENEKTISSYSLWDGSGNLLRSWEPLYKHGRFSYEIFKGSCTNQPHVIPMFHLGTKEEDKTRWTSYDHVRFQYCRKLADEQVINLTPENSWVFRHLGSLGGACFLMKACEYVEANNIKKLRSNRDLFKAPSLSEAITILAKIKYFDAHDDPQTIIAHLRKFKPETLKVILPVSGVGEELILAALGQDEIKLVNELVRRLTSQMRWNSDSTDPMLGVLDTEEIKAVIAKAGEKEAQAVLAQIKKTNPDQRSTVQMIETVFGWDEADLQKSLAKRGQMAVRAFGLVPLPKEKTQRQAECLRRYVWLRNFAKESSKFGAGRQVNERAAAAAGLENLARNAGYGDATRLEWAMEANLSDQATGENSVKNIGGYRVTLQIIDGTPSIQFAKNDKILRSAPEAIRKSKVYVELKKQVANLKSQHGRFRSSLESMLALGDMLSLDDLQRITKFPVAKPLLENLVFVTKSGKFGIYNSEKQVLEGLSGKTYKLQDFIRIAHAWHLFEANQLSEWQGEVIRRHTVQPFKQVFRELYIVTPAELATARFSNRFAGHNLAAPITAKLLQSRNWRIDNDHFEEAVATKIFPQAKMRASFVIKDAGNYLGESEFVLSDQILFEPYPTTSHFELTDPEAPRIQLKDVPPLIFSEVMRDADLVVSVAQRADEIIMSEESYVRRAELVSSIVADLGLPGVRVEGHFAHVTGTLANYRVHLGSAVIHIEPGNYLCIVPERWGQKTDKLYLPFADGDDSKASEVISKVILLVNDKKIKDESILAQIPRSARL